MSVSTFNGIGCAEAQMLSGQETSQTEFCQKIFAAFTVSYLFFHLFIIAKTCTILKV